MDLIEKKKHLLSRASFGLSLSEYRKMMRMDIPKILDALFLDSKPKQFSLATAGNDYNSSSASKKPNIHLLRAAWLKEMTKPFDQGALQSKMSFFWHNYFPLVTKKIAIAQPYLNLIYRHSLGNFKDLLHEIITNPGFIIFLNLNGVKKAQPNENFARELLELFTLGINNYTETDVQQIARCFTGWKLDRQKKFRFDRNEFDSQSKSFLGKTGNFDGNQVVDILLQNRKCCDYLAEKLYLFFVSSDSFDTSFIRDISNKLWNTSYDLKQTLRFLFEDDRFYRDEYLGKKIKSPIELIVHIAKNLSLSFKNTSPFFIAQNLLGQRLFDPPNVGGWPTGINWIDSNSLLIRLNLARLFTDNQNAFLGKDNIKIAKNHILKKINAKREVSDRSSLKGYRHEEICNALIIASKSRMNLIRKTVPDNKKSLQSMVEFMSLPEFQFI